MSAIQAERFDTWVRGSRGPRRRALLEAAIPEILGAPHTAPPEAEHAVGLLGWLLGHAVAGAPLTATFALSPALVIEFCSAFAERVYFPGRREADVVELWGLRELADDLKLLRRSGRTLHATPRGRAVHAGGLDTLWCATADGLLAGSDADSAAAELGLLLLLGEGSMPSVRLSSEVAAILAEDGWSARDGTPIDEHSAGMLVGQLRRRLHLLALVKERRFGDPLDLTAVGRELAWTALRRHARRPRASIG